MLKDIIRDLTENNEKLIIDTLPYDLKENTYYLKVDLNKDIAEQPLENILGYMIYNSETKELQTNDIVLERDIKKYLPYSYLFKNVAKKDTFDYSASYFSRNKDKETIVNNSPNFNFVDFRIAIKKHKENTDAYFDNEFNFNGLFKTLDFYESSNYIKYIQNKLLSSNTYLNVEKYDQVKLLDIITEKYNLNHFNEQTRLSNFNKIKEYLIKNEQGIAEKLKELANKLVEDKELRDFLNIVIVFDLDLNFVKNEYISVSKFLYMNSEDSGVLDNETLFSNAKQEIFESDKKYSYRNYLTDLNKINKSNQVNKTNHFMFSKIDEIESLNYYLFLVYLVNSAYRYKKQIYTEGVISLLFSKNPHNNVYDNVNNFNEDGYLLSYKKVSNTMIELVDFNNYLVSNISKKINLKTTNYSIQDKELTYSIVNLETTKDILEKIDRDMFNYKLLSYKQSNVKNNKIQSRIDSIKTDFIKNYYFKNIDYFKNKNYSMVINQIQDMFYEYFTFDNSNQDRNFKIGTINILNSIQLFADLFEKGGSKVLKQSEIEEMKNKYVTKQLEETMTDKEYLFLIGNLSKILYNTSNNNNKIQFIDRIYSAHNFAELVDRFNQLSFKFFKSVEYKQKYQELWDLLNKYEDHNLNKVTKEDRIAFMNGFLSKTNLYYTKKTTEEIS